MNNKLIQVLKASGTIPEQDLPLIAQAFEKREYQEGSYLLNPGRICKELFFICDGVLRIVKPHESGNEVTHFFLPQGRFCYLLKSFQDQEIAQEGIQASCKTTVLAISKNRLAELYQAFPYLASIIDRIISLSLQDKVMLRNSYLGLNAAARYQHFLKQQKEVANLVPLTQVASYLGIALPSLSRIRRSSR